MITRPLGIESYGYLHVAVTSAQRLGVELLVEAHLALAHRKGDDVRMGHDRAEAGGYLLKGVEREPAPVEVGEAVELLVVRAVDLCPGSGLELRSG